MAGTERGAFDSSAAVRAGVIAGAVFMALQMAMVPVFLGGSPWAPPRMAAAIVMGRDILPAPDAPGGITVGVLAVAATVHLGLAVVYALAVAWIVDGWPFGASISAGAIFGLALYLINYYGFTALFPWFAAARNWVGIVTHIAFGAVAAAGYTKLATRAVRAAGARASDRTAAD